MHATIDTFCIGAMSFSDLPRRGSAGIGGAASSSGGPQQGGFGSIPAQYRAHTADPLMQITELLQLYEKMSAKIKASVTEMRRRKVSLAEKQELDTQIRNLKDVEGKLKNQVSGGGGGSGVRGSTLCTHTSRTHL